jgi:hypothetical protein
VGTPAAPDPSAVPDLQPDASAAPEGLLPPRPTDTTPVTFSYTGGTPTYTGLAGSNSLIVHIAGASGGGQPSGLGGWAPTIYVGGFGQSNQGHNGGGNSSTQRYGNGAADLRQGGAALTNRVLVAGGGGGLTGGSGGGYIQIRTGTNLMTVEGGRGGTQLGPGFGGSGNPPGSRGNGTSNAAPDDYESGCYQINGAGRCGSAPADGPGPDGPKAEKSVPRTVARQGLTAAKP